MKIRIAIVRQNKRTDASCKRPVIKVPISQRSKQPIERETRPRSIGYIRRFMVQPSFYEDTSRRHVESRGNIVRNVDRFPPWFHFSGERDTSMKFSRQRLEISIYCLVWRVLYLLNRHLNADLCLFIALNSVEKHQARRATSSCS